MAEGKGKSSWLNPRAAAGCAQSKAGQALEEEARALQAHMEAGDAQLLGLQSQLDELRASSSATIAAMGAQHTSRLAGLRGETLQL